MNEINHKIANEFTTFKNSIYKEIVQFNAQSKLISFKYLLPYRVPVSDNEKFVFRINSNKSILIVFTHKEVDAVDDYLLNKKIYTYVECTSIVNKKVYKKIAPNSKSRVGRVREKLTYLFNEQFEALNKFINIIILKYQYHNLFPLTLGDIKTVPIYMLYNGKKDILIESLFRLRGTNKIESDELSTLNYNQIEHIVTNYGIYLNHPSNRTVLTMRKSERAYFNYDYNESIIYAQTALEIFIFEVVVKYYKLLNLKNENELKNLEDCKFSNLINHHLLKLISQLGLNNHEELKNCIKKYLNSYYPMRNDIIHEGKTYNLKETDQFLKIVNDFIRLFTYNIHKASSNPFVEEFVKYNIVNPEIKFDEIVNKYSK